MRDPRNVQVGDILLIRDAGGVERTARVGAVQLRGGAVLVRPQGGLPAGGVLARDYAFSREQKPFTWAFAD